MVEFRIYRIFTQCRNRFSELVGELQIKDLGQIKFCQEVIGESKFEVGCVILIIRKTIESGNAVRKISNDLVKLNMLFLVGRYF